MSTAAVSVLLTAVGGCTVASLAAVASTASGGGGRITLGGRVAKLHIDTSSRADVTAFAGAPSAEGRGNFGAFTSHGRDPDFEALGYSCGRRAANGGTINVGHGPYCETVFYINQKTGRLAALFTSSASYVGPDGVRPGMATSEAEHRTRMKALAGCLSGLLLGTARTPTQLFVDIAGGHYVQRRERNGSAALRIVGGRVASFSVESDRHPVGLLFC